MSDERFGIDELRGAVALFGNCNETFNQRFTADQLVALWRAYKASEWDFTPDRWQPRQVEEALAGKVPEWDAGEDALYR